MGRSLSCSFMTILQMTGPAWGRARRGVMEVARSRRVVGKNFIFVELMGWEVGRFEVMSEGS